MQNAQQQGAKAPKPPKGAIGGVAGLLLLGGAAVLFNNALFNGQLGARYAKLELTGA